MRLKNTLQTSKLAIISRRLFRNKLLSKRTVLLIPGKTEITILRLHHPVSFIWTWVFTKIYDDLKITTVWKGRIDAPFRQDHNTVNNHHLGSNRMKRIYARSKLADLNPFCSNITLGNAFLIHQDALFPFICRPLFASKQYISSSRWSACLLVIM